MSEINWMDKGGVHILTLDDSQERDFDKLAIVAKDMYEHHEASGLYSLELEEWKQWLIECGVTPMTRTCGDCANATESNFIHCTVCSCDVRKDDKVLLCGGRHYEERTDSPEKLIRDMLKFIMLARDLDAKLGSEAGNEYAKRAREMGIEVEA